MHTYKHTYKQTTWKVNVHMG